VLTGGGDAPGLDPVIRAIVKAAVNVGAEVVGLEASFDGLLIDDKCRLLTPADVRGILRLGGTTLGTRAAAMLLTARGLGLCFGD
jgi:6-phosphofructokinase 1